MRNEICLPDNSQIAREILSYLRKHPDAHDTMEGIQQTWLSDRKDWYEARLIQEVVKDLVLVGRIVEEKKPGSSTVFRLNIAERNRTISK